VHKGDQSQSLAGAAKVKHLCLNPSPRITFLPQSSLKGFCRLKHAPASERRIKQVASLSRKKGRDQLNSFLIEGIRSLHSATVAGADIVDIFVEEGAMTGYRSEKLEESFVDRTYSVSARDMNKMADTTTSPGILAVAKIPEPKTDCILCYPKVLVLDGVQDPGNVGTLVRTAAWFGVDSVVAGPGTADFYAPKTVRSAMGGIWDLQLERVETLGGFLETCRRNDVDIRYADMQGTPVQDWEAPENSILIIGSEAHGVSEEVRSKADGAVSIAPAGSETAVESLNAAIAGGIIMSHW